MRVAVFTAEFPGRINTFFARDMSALLRAGLTIDVFPIYPLEADHWSAVPECLSADVLPRDRVHHIGPLAGFVPRRHALPWRTSWRYVRDMARVRTAACRFGPVALAKSEYAGLKAWAWARATAGGNGGGSNGASANGASANEANNVPRYGHVLAYWGNYAATAAWLFRRLVAAETPLSILLHAHDLYARQVFMREKLLSADNVLVVCDFNRRFLAETFPDIYPRIAGKLHLHHLGLDVGAVTPVFEGRAPQTCLAVGRLDPSKGFDDLLRAAAIVRRRGIEIEVAIAGDGEQAGALRALAASLGIADRVRFLGWLAFDQVPAVMRQATLLVHPSCGLGDAVPTVIKEAMALGTPVIGSTAVGIPELLDHGRCGLLVPERRADRLADAIARLLGDPAQRLRLAHDARAFAERTFDVWRNGLRLADLLRGTASAEREGA
jgi:glycosyltransferase involved in cell wall biosynthesis